VQAGLAIVFALINGAQLHAGFNHQQSPTSDVFKTSLNESCIKVNLGRHIHTTLFCLIGVGLGGCATTTDIPPGQSQMHAPIKILVMQSPMTINPGRLQKVLAPDIKPKLSVSDEPIAQGVKHSQEQALAAMKSDLIKQSRLTLVTPPKQEKQLLNKIQGENFDTAISQDVADRIQTTTGADAILRFGITDYGLTPKSWRTGYITFEVVSTLAIAGVIAYAGSTAAKAAAGAYLAQETVEETAESYAGFWALDVVCRPVRIEAELIGLNPVNVLWKYSDTGLSDVSLSRLTRKVGTDERDKQLDQSTDYAVNDVVTDLSDALTHHNTASPAERRYMIAP
jgi:hypothetical protein